MQFPDKPKAHLENLKRKKKNKKKKKIEIKWEDMGGIKFSV